MMTPTIPFYTKRAPCSFQGNQILPALLPSCRDTGTSSAVREIAQRVSRSLLAQRTLAASAWAYHPIPCWTQLNYWDLLGILEVTNLNDGCSCDASKVMTYDLLLDSLTTIIMGIFFITLLVPVHPAIVSVPSFQYIMMMYCDAWWLMTHVVHDDFKYIW